MMQSVVVEDLIGLPYREKRCAELALMVLRDRIGLDVPPHAMGVDLCDRRNAAQAVAYLDAGDAWERLGERPTDAKRLGDLVVWGGRPAPHVAVLVDERGAMLLTTLRDGGAHMLPASRVPAASCAVYRWRR